MKRLQWKGLPLRARVDDEVTDQVAMLADVTALARELSPLDRLRLIEMLVATLERDWPGQAPAPRRSLYGLWRDLGPAPSAEEIDEARHDALGELPPRADTPI